MPYQHNCAGNVLWHRGWNVQKSHKPEHPSKSWYWQTSSCDSMNNFDSNSIFSRPHSQVLSHSLTTCSLVLLKPAPTWGQWQSGMVSKQSRNPHLKACLQLPLSARQKISSADIFINLLLHSSTPLYCSSWPTSGSDSTSHCSSCVLCYQCKYSATQKLITVSPCYPSCNLGQTLYKKANCTWQYSDANNVGSLKKSVCRAKLLQLQQKWQQQQNEKQKYCTSRDIFG